MKAISLLLSEKTAKKGYRVSFWPILKEIKERIQNHEKKTVKIGRCVFDAKSLMSVLMIAGNPDAVVEAHTNDIEAFKKKFKDYLQ